MSRTAPSGRGLTAADLIARGASCRLAVLLDVHITRCAADWQATWLHRHHMALARRLLSAVCQQSNLSASSWTTTCSFSLTPAATSARCLATLAAGASASLQGPTLQHPVVAQQLRVSGLPAQPPLDSLCTRLAWLGSRLSSSSASPPGDQSSSTPGPPAPPADSQAGDVYDVNPTEMLQVSLGPRWIACC